jgi:cobyrinic acid a,c-diamide synthase
MDQRTSENESHRFEPAMGMIGERLAIAVRPEHLGTVMPQDQDQIEAAIERVVQRISCLQVANMLAMSGADGRMLRCAMKRL